jgi:ABC-type sugar transport system ATPase subunit
MAILVEFRGVSYRVGDREILHEIDLCVEEGETMGLLGRSGSGKTTMLKMVNRLVEPTAGEVRFEGRRVSDWDPIRLRRRMGYVFQEGGLFPHATVARNVGLVPALEGWPLARPEFVVLQDDRRYFPPYECALVVRQATLERYPRLRAVLAELSGRLSDSAIRRMNESVDVEHRAAAEVARDFLN